MSKIVNRKNVKEFLYFAQTDVVIALDDHKFKSTTKSARSVQREDFAQDYMLDDIDFYVNFEDTALWRLVDAMRLAVKERDDRDLDDWLDEHAEPRLRLRAYDVLVGSIIMFPHSDTLGKKFSY